MDYETIVNCFVGVFVHYKDDSISKVFTVHKEQNDFPAMVKFLNDNVQLNQWHISYNGLAFDAQITQWMISKQKELLKLSTDKLVAAIYARAQEIIATSERGEFQQYAPRQIKIRQIDLFKMNHWDNKAKMSSLKWIQYSMDWENVEEMPHAHYEPVEDPDTLQKVISYCFNDVLSTKKILEHSKEQIVLRQSLTKEYGIDLYSASETRISKELFLHILSQRLGWEKSHIKSLKTYRTHIVLADCILPYVKFQTPEFQKVLDYFRTKVITSTKDGFKYSLKFKGVKTDFGLGGIHGAADAGVYKAEAGWTIMTSDVTSFYPNLAIKNGFAPEHLPKEQFLDLYEWIFEERKKIPKSDPKNYVYKIILNSTYGLTGDENSFLYDPRMTMQITVNGQLLLSQLYEMITLAIPEAKPLMQNTDGLEMMIPSHKVDKYMEICNEWCKLTQLQLEHDQYTKMIIRDVNNYIAVVEPKKVQDDNGTPAKQVWEKMRAKTPSYIYFEKNGEYFYQPTKCKGAFEWEDLQKKKVASLHKNKSFLIIPKAIYAYFVEGIMPEDYLSANRNVVDYCAGIKARGGWHYEARSIANGAVLVNRLQKIVRYYVSNGGSKLVKCHNDGREIQVESGQWMQTVLNQFDPAVSFSAYDINDTYYLEEIYKQIEQIEKERPHSLVQLSLF